MLTLNKWWFFLTIFDYCSSDADFISPVHVSDVVKPRKNFKHFHDKKIERELKNVCRLLGYYGNLKC